MSQLESKDAVFTSHAIGFLYPLVNPLNDSTWNKQFTFTVNGCRDMRRHYYLAIFVLREEYNSPKIYLYIIYKYIHTYIWNIQRLTIIFLSSLNEFGNVELFQIYSNSIRIITTDTSRSFTYKMTHIIYIFLQVFYSKCSSTSMNHSTIRLTDIYKY